MSQTIESILEELDVLASSSTKVLGMGKKAMVDSEKLAEIASNLRESVPADILEAGEVIKQKESILNQAYLEGKRLRETAGQEAVAMTNVAHSERESMISEHEIVKAAEAKAEEIKDEARRQANEIVQESQHQSLRLMGDAEATASDRREGADQYSREVLFSIEERLAQMLGQARRGIDALGVEAEPQASQQAVNGAAAAVNGAAAKE